MILLSNTYAQSSDDRPECRAVDPENRWLWRANRRRLDFEAMRDALLAAAGRLDTALDGRSIDIWAQPYSTRRSVYAFVDRQDLPGIFRIFDFASPDVSTPQRPTTSVPQQATFWHERAVCVGTSTLPGGPTRGNCGGRSGGQGAIALSSGHSAGWPRRTKCNWGARSSRNCPRRLPRPLRVRRPMRPHCCRPGSSMPRRCSCRTNSCLSIEKSCDVATTPQEPRTRLRRR